MDRNLPLSPPPVPSSGEGDSGERRAYCPACGMHVGTLELLQGGDLRTHCEQCGGLLGGTETPPPRLQRVLVADDTRLLREILVRELKSRGVTREAEGVGDGQDFMGRCAAGFKAGTPPDLVVLDLEMPRVGGLQAARSLRDLERSLGRSRGVPILFFTGSPCDAAFRAVLEELKPAAYLNKGVAGSASEIAERAAVVIARLTAQKGTP